MKINRYILFTTLILALSPRSQAEDALVNSTNLNTTIENDDERSIEERVDFLISIGGIYEEQGELDAAIKAYERVLELIPRYDTARNGLSHLYIINKNYKKAEKLLLELIEEFPDSFGPCNNIAWLYATAEDLEIRSGEKAVRYAQEALMIAPLSYHVWSTLSEAHYINGDYQKALDAIQFMATQVIMNRVELTKENVDEYNDQINKCNLALETMKVLEESEEAEKEQKDTAKK